MGLISVHRSGKGTSEEVCEASVGGWPVRAKTINDLARLLLEWGASPDIEFLICCNRSKQGVLFYGYIGHLAKQENPEPYAQVVYWDTRLEWAKGLG